MECSLRTRLLRLLACCVTLVSACFVYVMPASAASNDLDEIVARFRKIIVLTDSQTPLDPLVREQATTIGRVLFESNHEELENLGATLAADIATPAAPNTTAFLTRL